MTGPKRELTGYLEEGVPLTWRYILVPSEGQQEQIDLPLVLCLQRPGINFLTDGNCTIWTTASLNTSDDVGRR